MSPSIAGPAEIDAPALQRLLHEGRAVLIDVREREEYEEEHIPGARLVPLSSFDPCLLAEAEGDRELVIHCLAGSRAEKAAQAVAAIAQRSVLTLKDGLFGWKGAGFETAGAEAGS